VTWHGGVVLAVLGMPWLSTVVGDVGGWWWPLVMVAWTMVVVVEEEVVVVDDAQIERRHLSIPFLSFWGYSFRVIPRTIPAECEFRSTFRWNSFINLAGNCAKIDSYGIPGIDRIPLDSSRNQWRTVKTSALSYYSVEQDKMWLI